ncbi:hypothetical protein TSAR_008598 [Trichomalopsis sarcophagae]|uniref:Uncharacterized protein n=1 Tax=Trichomalopsis sarcophagae TaxID=543379 RepID=A0A232F9R4_9HYME|nr:hypothetical protein TSAR_008598 [Trichomalopsis sarcophagae]
MTFYLLAVVVALTTIFGLAHSQTAREKLRLQNFYTWSVATIQEQLESIDSNEARRNAEDGEVIQVLQITVDQLEIPQPKEVEASGSVEEIQGIRVGGQRFDEPQTLSPETPNPQPQHQPTPKPSGIPRSTTIKRSSGAKDNVLAAINASLQKLTTAANSGRINGAQLYNILLQETMRHDEVVNGANSSADTATIQEIDENAEVSEKPRMYFGESPLEYVPHQTE